MHTLLRPVSATVVVVTIAGLLAGCSGDAPDPRQTGLTRWSSLMQTALTDPEQGAGAASGLGGGTVSLDVPGGDWDLLLACNGVDGKYFRATSGDDVATVFGRTDAPCGVTTRMAVTVPRTGGLTIRVRALSDAPEAVRRGDVTSYWYVAVVPAGFEPEDRTYDLG